MEQEKPKKNGGPYTKKEQEERRLKVYQHHFVEKKSAVEISVIVGVNRNTINDDINFWYQQLSNQLEEQDLQTRIVTQLQRKEIRRGRLFEYLEETENLNEKIRIEKLMNEIDDDLYHYYSKMISNGITKLKPTVKPVDIDESEIKEFVRELVLSDTEPFSDDVYSEEELITHYIERTKCDVEYAKSVIKKMIRDGLSQCEQIGVNNKNTPFHVDPSYTYNLAKFGKMRSYLTKDEIVSLEQKRTTIKQEMEKAENKRRANIPKGYVPQSESFGDMNNSYDINNFLDNLYRTKKKTKRMLQ